MQKFSLLSEGHIDFHGGKIQTAFCLLFQLRREGRLKNIRKLQKLPLPVGNELV